MWVIYLMGTLAGVTAVTTGMLAIMHARTRQHAATLLFGACAAFSAWLAAYVFAEPFRRWCDAVMGWTSW
jgi:hypothetical protein